MRFLCDYTKLFESPHQLHLERESEKHWIVTDTGHDDLVMFRSPDPSMCARFIVAFYAKHGGEPPSSEGGPKAVRDASTSPVPAADAAAEPPPLSDDFSVKAPDNVFPLWRDAS